jgi:catechol 2,3-dioxygenase-like lactoylglutathione lyase family enzyme
MSAATLAAPAEPKTTPLEVLETSTGTAEFFSLTIFTHRWREIRDFYVEILNARILREMEDRYCEMDIAGLPVCFRTTDYGETVSYFHLSVALQNREPVLRELRRRGIIVTQVGPFINFRDPEGRVIKLSEEKKSAS